jgi:predicted MPP superfamily phosphohydrolase
MAAMNASLLGGWVAKWSYRMGLHGRLGVTSHRIRVRQADHLHRPLVVAFASDFHAGPSTHPDMFTKLLDALVAHEPDVLLLGGDYVSYEADCVDVLAETLSRCNPPLGKYAVLGNHDLWSDHERITSPLIAAGVDVLVNRSVTLPDPFNSVSVCGIDDPWTGDADVPGTFKDAGAIRIFLTHSPDALLLLREEYFDVGFAGHTHGGQVALPDGTPIIGAGGPLSRTYARGRFDIPGKGPLIVSTGVGCSNFPIRINADPELVICTLHP